MSRNKILVDNRFRNIFFIIFGIALLLRVWYMFYSSVLWWDETIYIGMAKFLFSAGTLGYWEAFRPVVLPVVLGSGWLIGLPIVLWGKIVELFFSMGVIYLVYRIGEYMRPRAGLIASGIIAFLPVFVGFGNKLLTGIPSIFFTLCALWFLLRKKWYLTGLFIGIAFLTRFLFSLSAIAIGLALIIEWLSKNNDSFSKKQILIVLKKIALLVAGFFTITLPFFISNYFLYGGEILFPLTEGSRVFTQLNNWLYDLGNWYYVQQLFIQNVLLVFFVVGIVAFFILRKYKNRVWNAVLLLMIAFITYFFIVVHKEVRFFIVVYPLIAIYAGVGLSWLIDIIQKRFSQITNTIVLSFITFLLILSILISVLATPIVSPESKMQETQEEFYTYFSDKGINDPLFIASSPLFIVYTDKPVTMMRDWNLISEVYTEYSDASHLAIDFCDKPCENGSECEQFREDFLFSISSEEIVFNKSYARWDGENCSVMIWDLSIN